ncbi:Aldehyde reductase 2-like protein 1 [Stagonosporopsis vannaccii]|nr:Aldehyde reductase 2-like protein 1 [Stagonosporopsis vannaccii]
MEIPGAGSTVRWVRYVHDFPSEVVFVAKLRDDSPQYQVDVEDIAKLHLAALAFEDVCDERLFGFAYKFNYNSFLRVLRELSPEREWLADDMGLGLPSMVIEDKRSIELLKRFGAKDWVPFEENIRRSCLGEYGQEFCSIRRMLLLTL